jgi:hypothetical protein
MKTFELRDQKRRERVSRSRRTTSTSLLITLCRGRSKPSIGWIKIVTRDFCLTLARQHQKPAQAGLFVKSCCSRNTNSKQGFRKGSASFPCKTSFPLRQDSEDRLRQYVLSLLFPQNAGLRAWLAINITTRQVSTVWDCNFARAEVRQMGHATIQSAT